MSGLKEKRDKRIRRHKRVRSRIVGTSDRPRLSVFRSSRHIWAQLIDDAAGKTIVAASDLEAKSKTQGRKLKQEEKKLPIAGKVGELIAQGALEKKITTAVFDKGGYRYHGIVKAVADGARKGGLKF